MRNTIGLGAALVLAGVLAACSTAGGAAAPATAELDAVVAAEPTPDATIKNVSASVPPPVMTDGEGAEVVTGIVTNVNQTAKETVTEVNGVTEVRGGEVLGTHVSNDVRANGQTRLTFNVDLYTTTGPLWATLVITNDAGAWSGTCTGVSLGAGQLGPMSCWLTGSGAYEGWTYYQASRSNTNGAAAATEGAIYEGEPPTG